MTDPVPEGRLNCMGHTYISALFHCVFSTKGRCGLIPPAKQPDLWAYLGGIARKNGFKTLAIGGTDNHVHVLLSLPSTVSLAKAVQLLKGGSSKWMNDSGASGFAWQDGYGGFSLGISQQSDTIAYIRAQAEHHHKRGFEEEFRGVPQEAPDRIRPQPCLGLISAVPPGLPPSLRSFPGAEAPGYCQSPLPGLRICGTSFLIPAAIHRIVGVKSATNQIRTNVHHSHYGTRTAP